MFLGITKRIEGKQGWCFICYKSVSIQITRSLRYFTIKIRENLTEFDCLLFVNDGILWCDSIFTEHKKYWKNIFFKLLPKRIDWEGTEHERSYENLVCFENAYFPCFFTLTCFDVGLFDLSLSYFICCTYMLIKIHLN